MPEKAYEMSNGRVVDDAEIERLVAEAEEGYDPDLLRRCGGRKLMG